MSAKAGEVSRETTTYRCECCHHRVVARAGALISECEMCGSPSFKTGWANWSARPSRSQAEALFRKAG